MKNNKVMALILSIIFVLSMTACSSSGSKTSTTDTAKSAPAASSPTSTPALSSSQPASGQTFNLTMGTSAATGSNVDLTMKYAKKILEERSSGKIKLDLFPDAQLGSDRELVEGCQLGNVSMVIGATSPQTAFVPSLAVFDLPNAFKSLDVAQKVLSGFQGTMEGKYSASKLKLLSLYPATYRFMSSNKEVKSINDFAGIKIRTMENPYHLSYWKTLCANPTPLAWNEVYVALQQKMVDAQENPLDVIFSSKVYEQQKYIINTKHIVFVTSIIMNQKLWDSMPKEYQKMMTESFNEAAKYAVSISAKSIDDNKAKLEAQGLKFIELGDDVLTQMKERAKPVYDSIRKDVGADIVDPLLQAIEKEGK